ncbi:hypothetical protein [Kribbella sp. NPDC049227]|uniref:hypothetical protein n=1 Tax=Kribbella sp. NPDC049227 TaxID=3364113 RepID=UPI00371F6B89
MKNPSAFPTDVTFHKMAIPLKAYELRTGRLVARTTLQINGSSCPRTLHFTSYFDSDLYVPSTEYVTPTSASVRAAFQPVVVRP